MPNIKETGIIPVKLEELVPGNVISIIRLRVAGGNQWGRPQAETIEDNTFSDFKEAIKWSSESPEYSHSFEIPLPVSKLSARLSGDRGGSGEKLIVFFEDRVVESPRSVDKHHGVSTDYETFFNIIIHLDHKQSTLFDRGVVWVDLSNNNAKPNLTFHINAGVHTEDELKQGILQMFDKVDKTLNDLVRGE